MTAGISCCWRETRFGPVAVVWSRHRGQERICRVVLSSPDRLARQFVRVAYPECASRSTPAVDRIADGIAAFLSGEEVSFPAGCLRLDACSPFQRAVLQIDSEIPRGRVSSYQRIADRLGIGRAARAVGRALATNPLAILIPCHRVVRADGTPGGYGGGVAMKRALLEMEGVRFDRSGRVDRGRLLA